MFKEIGALTRKFKLSVKVITNKNGNSLIEHEDILDRWKEYCSKMYMDKDTNLNETKVDTFEKEPQLVIAEVEHAIKSLEGGKSPRCDVLTVEMIKAGEKHFVITCTLYQDLEY